MARVGLIFGALACWYISSIDCSDIFHVPNKKCELFDFNDYFKEVSFVVLIGKDDRNKICLMKQLFYKGITIVNYRNAERYETLSDKSNVGVIFLVMEEDNVNFEIFKTVLKDLYRPRVAVVFQGDSGVKTKDFGMKYHTYFKDAWKELTLINFIIVLTDVSETPPILTYNPFCVEDDDCRKNVEVFNASKGSYADFNKYPFKVAMFTRTPTAFKENNGKIHMPFRLLKDAKFSNDFLGIDGFLLGNFIKHYNLELVIVPYESGDYGHGQKNGTVTGILKDVVLGSVDAAFNGRFVKDYGTEEFEFTQNYYNDAFCAIVRKTEALPILSFYFDFIKLPVYVLIVAFGLFKSVLLSAMEHFFTAKKRRKRFNVLRVYNFGLFSMESVLSLFISVPVFKSSLTRERAVMAAFLLLNVILVGTFQSTMNMAFSGISYYPDIDTLKKLDESNYKISTSLKAKDVFSPHIGPVYQSLASKVFSLNVSAINQSAVLNNIAALERKTDAKIILKTHYLTPEGYHILHIVDECPITYYLAYIIKKGSPFQPALKTLITRVVEAGFPEYWQSYTEYYLTMKSIPEETSKSKKLAKLKLKDVVQAFYILSYGICTATLIFLVEILRACKKKSDNIISLY